MKLNKLIGKMILLSCLASIAYAEEENSGKSTEQSVNIEKKTPSHFSLGVVGVYSNTTANGSVEVKQGSRTRTVEGSASGNSMGLGILPELKFSEQFGLEMGLFFLPRKITENGDSLTFKTLMITPMARIHIVPQYLSLGIGGFLSQGLGDLKEKEKSGTVTSTSYSDYQFKRHNWGAAAAIGATLPLSEKVSMLLETRYLYGISPVYKQNASFIGVNTEAKIKMNDFQAMTGLKFNL